MKLSIQEIDDKLKEISEEHSKLFDQEQKLNNEKNRLLAKDICDNKRLGKCTWKASERYKSGFILRPILNGTMELDDIQTELSLYPHGYFELSKDIEICGSDGDLYIVSYDTKIGIEFIKSQNMKIVINENVIENIASMEKQVAELKELISQFGTILQDNCITSDQKE